MNIKTTFSGDIPFLQKYEPFIEPMDTKGVYDIRDMISYDLRANINNTRINYSIGSDKSYVTTLNIKNITINNKLRVTIIFDKNVFLINKNITTTGNRSRSVTEMLPGQVEEIIIQINSDQLNQSMAFQLEEAPIKLIVENITLQELTLKSTVTTVYAEKILPDTITLD